MAIVMLFAIAYAGNSTNSTASMTLDVKCDTIMYGGDDREWTLGYLREIVKYCSNGGQ